MSFQVANISYPEFCFVVMRLAVGLSHKLSIIAVGIITLALSEAVLGAVCLQSSDW